MRKSVTGPVLSPDRFQLRPILDTHVAAAGLRIETTSRVMARLEQSRCGRT